MRRAMGIAVLALFALFPFQEATAQQAPANSSRCPQDQGAGTSGQYPPRRGALQLSRSAARPGEPVTARGCGFRPGSQVTLDFFSQPVQVGTATAGADGGFAITFNIPTSATAGEHTVEATGIDPAGQPRVLSANIQVIGGADLPRTGSSSTTPLTAAGVGLVLLGTAAVYGARRRRAQRARI